MHRIVITAAILLAVVGCSQAQPPTRQSRLLALASDEANLITDPGDRLSRELNFAYDQSARGQKTEAKSSLAHAAETLRGVGPKQLDEQKWIAGWVSISELSRAIGDTPTADAACDQAVALLRKLDPVQDRPKFAVGVSRQLYELHGPAAAAKLLEESAAWTASIKEQPVRRLALVQITESIFTCDDFDGGLAVLRREPNAAWRSDTLRDLAHGDRYPGALFVPIVVDQGPVGATSTFLDANGNGSGPAQYSQPVDFQSVFRRGN
jgi:hypothetical protein